MTLSTDLLKADTPQVEGHINFSNRLDFKHHW